MPLKIINRDITKIECDVIVNPTDPYYSHGGGVDAAIHRAAGYRLFDACVNSGKLELGEIVVTDAFDLPCKYVIHTVGPVWINGLYRERVFLESCYKKSLERAFALDCQSIAFPLISAGTNGYPKDQVLKIAMNVIAEFLREHEMLVYMVVRDKSAYELTSNRFDSISAYLDAHWHSRPLAKRRRESSRIDELTSEEYEEHWLQTMKCIPVERREQEEKAFHEARELVTTLEWMRESTPYQSLISHDDLGFALDNMDKSFSEMLFYYIDMKGMSDVECYKRANVDRKTFSKIKCNADYRPSKVTAVSFAIALRLDMDETQNLLRTAGMTLSRSNKFDVIIGYFISVGIYDINEINEALFKFDQLLLGC